MIEQGSKQSVAALQLRGALYDGNGSRDTMMLLLLLLLPMLLMLTGITYKKQGRRVPKTRSHDANCLSTFFCDFNCLSDVAVTMIDISFNKENLAILKRRGCRLAIFRFVCARNALSLLVEM